MTDNTKNVKIAIRHYPEASNFNVGDIDLGPLIGGLTDEPFRIARRGEDGRIRIEVERTHESEYILGILIAGGIVFAKSVLETLGKRLGNWVADWAERKIEERSVEVRDEQGNSVEIDPNDPAATRTQVVELIEAASELGATVTISFPW